MTERYDTVEELDADATAAFRELMYRLADDEYVIAERDIEWQIYAPTLESDLALANIAQDELGHARLWYEVLKDFGYDETDLIWERDADDFTHSTLVEQPFAEGDWADAIVRAYLYDVAEDIRLHALQHSTFGPIRDRVGKVLGEEDYHLEYATNWLERLAADDEGRENIQDAVDRLYPYALTLFEPTDEEVEATIVESGLRGEDLVELRDTWHDRVGDFFESIGIEVPGMDLPDQYDVHISPNELPEHLGRDGDHTEHWASLLDEMTEAYDELGRDYATHIMDGDE